MKNDSGADECDIDVIVLDRPGKPEGPLEATETTTDSVSLQWKPPKDDGGGDITGKELERSFTRMDFFRLGYIIEKCPENSDRWEKVPGVFDQPKGTVKDLETNKKYKFRVKAENIYGISEPLETTAAITVKPPYGKEMSYLILTTIHSSISHQILRMHLMPLKLSIIIPHISNSNGINQRKMVVIQ